MADAGWHLKVAEGPARTEFQSEARTERVPESLTRRLAGVLAGQELGEVATITTTRCASRLVDEQGALLAEVADDRVFGAGIGEVATLERWREVQVELGPAGSEDLLVKITKAFRRAEAHPAPVQRKLDRLFAREGSAPRRRTVNSAVGAYLQVQCRAILLGDIALRDRPEPEAVHKTRVATRRLRSTLARRPAQPDPRRRHPGPAADCGGGGPAAGADPGAGGPRDRGDAGGGARGRRTGLAAGVDR